MAAVGAGVDDALALGPAAQADVEEAAKGQARDAREDGPQDANHDPRLSIRLRIGGWIEICGIPGLKSETWGTLQLLYPTLAEKAKARRRWGTRQKFLNRTAGWLPLRGVSKLAS